MRLDIALTEFAYSKDHSQASRQWYRSRLGAFTAWCAEQGIAEIEDITAPFVRRYIDYRRTSPAKSGRPLDSHTLHGHVRAIKALLNWAIREELLSEKVVKRIEMPKREQKVLAIFTPHQIDLLFAACDQGETLEYRVRDKALLAVLLDTGIRASEATGLTLEHVHFTPDEAWLHVVGKGRRQREVPLGRQARQLLHKYIHRHRPRNSKHSQVFLAKGDRPLTAEGLDRLLYRLRDRTGREHFQGVTVAAHRWRHTYAVRALEAGIDIYRLSRLMGHSSVQTTEGYLKALSARQARQNGVSVLDRLA